MKDSSEIIFRVIKVIGRVYLALFLFWLLLTIIVQDTLWWNAILTTYPFLVTAPGLIIVILLWWRQEKKVAAAIFVLLAGHFVFHYGVLFWPNQTGQVINGRSFTVMTYNIKFNNGNDESMLDAIRQADADIVGLQEITLDHTALLEEQLSSQYPHRVFAEPEFQTDVALLSKYPVVELKTFTMQPRRMSMHVVVDVDGQLLDLIVVQMTPNEFDNLNGQSLRIRTRERYNIRRVEVTDLIIELNQNTSNPAIVLCDCNLVETSEVYRFLAKRMHDAYKDVGWGFGKTFWQTRIPIPMVRSDYIWYSDGLNPTRVQFSDRGPSDHRPLLATFNLGE